MRITLLVFCTAVFMAIFVLLRYGFNRAFFPFFHMMPHDEFVVTMEYCAIAVAVEFVNAAAIERVMFRDDMHIVQRLVNLVSNTRFRLFLVVGCGVCTLNVIVARMQVCSTCFHQS